ncbi:FmdE family protein [Geotalea sp. SG265]|uniref:FmdE family protein n=1 Tax=Geotalea sp. SG265 TaxID=2922867 RepID=UPI001FAF2B3D|nr:FmdE family protein [Geotalea sp. SG265]
MLIGIPAAGKSTFCRLNFFESHVRISLDMLRTRHRERLLLQACIDARQSFVVDDTNATREVRRRFMEPARAAGFRIIGYYFSSRLEEALKLNRQRQGRERIPDGGVRGIAGRLELPSLDEGFDELWYVRMDGSGGFEVREWEPGSDSADRGGCMKYEDIVRFHGHDCPGLAIGYRMAAAAMEALKAMRAGDEEIVAIVENDACGVDALQCISGCTFGKGNLVFRDYGKQVYTLFNRADGRGVRVVYRGEGIPAELSGDRAARTAFILGAPTELILSITEVTIAEPERAQSRPSVLCAWCGEEVMETRLREVAGERLCIPCAEGKTAH